MPDMYQELIKLADSEMYPFHMPGHKRNLESTPMKGAFRCDITEIDDFDNLHDEKGLILEAEKRANKLYGADKTFFLVNGSTSGVLSAVSAVVHKGGTVLAARGSHKSFYHSAYLRNLNIEYLPYKINTKFNIPEGYKTEDIMLALNKYDSEETNISAVFLTSPTYEGKVSDIEKISKVCHDKDIPLIVDAAHGAHFCLKGFPKSAVEQGADVVIHSLHKTLPSMTQTALMHVQGDLVDADRIKRFLRIYQSSSPSYVLMASIDECVKEMMQNGVEFADRLLDYRKRIQLETRDCKNIEIPSPDDIQDAAKVLIYVKNGAMTGQRLYDILREEYKLQLEMAGDKCALAIISGWDTEEGIGRLIFAIREIDDKISQRMSDSCEYSGKISNSKNGYRNSESGNICEVRLPGRAMSLTEAWDGEKEVIPISLIVEELRNTDKNTQYLNKGYLPEDGMTKYIAGEFINLYPPGIPIIVPGEIITEQILNDITKYLDEGLNVQGVTDRKEIICVKQK